jgi:hypothetical protein
MLTMATLYTTSLPNLASAPTFQELLECSLAVGPPHSQAG